MRNKHFRDDHEPDLETQYLACLLVVGPSPILKWNSDWDCPESNSTYFRQCEAWYKRNIESSRDGFRSVNGNKEYGFWRRYKTYLWENGYGE